LNDYEIVFAILWLMSDDQLAVPTCWICRRQAGSHLAIQLNPTTVKSVAAPELLTQCWRGSVLTSSLLNWWVRNPCHWRHLYLQFISRTVIQETGSSLYWILKRPVSDSMCRHRETNGIVSDTADLCLHPVNAWLVLLRTKYHVTLS